MAAFDMTYGNPQNFGGGGLGGIASIGINALNGYKTSVDFAEILRKINNERLVDQYRIPALAAGYNNSFFDSAARADKGQLDRAYTAQFRNIPIAQYNPSMSNVQEAYSPQRLDFTQQQTQRGTMPYDAYFGSGYNGMGYNGAVYPNY